MSHLDLHCLHKFLSCSAELKDVGSNTEQWQWKYLNHVKNGPYHTESADLDQPMHPHSLLEAFAARLHYYWILCR